MNKKLEDRNRDLLDVIYKISLETGVLINDLIEEEKKTANLTAELEDLEKRLDFFVITEHDNRIEITELKEKLELINEETVEAEARISEAEDELRDANTKIAELDDELTIEHEKLERFIELEKDFSDAEIEIQELEGELRTFREV